jgi:PRTRC genetic system protein C
MTANQMNRVFQLGAIKLTDPDPSLEPEDAIKLYSDNYPELAHAELSDGEYEDGELVYKVLQQKVGTKG